jgi:hypothetical protein
MLFCLKQLMSRFHVVALALLFAVTVAGCGGGSSTSTADMDGDGMMTTDPDPEPELTPAEQLAEAQQAVTDAQAMVDAATTSTERAAAYAALSAAETQLAAAAALPENQTAELEQQIIDLQRQIMGLQQERVVEAAIAAAMAAANALTVDSTDQDIADAKALVEDANTALTDSTALSMDSSEDLTGQIADVGMTISGIETDQADAAMTAELESVMGMVTAATNAVAALTGTSSDTDVEDAKKAITDAQAALEGATLISAADRTAQQEAINGIDIAGAETMITNARADAVVAETKAAGTKEMAIGVEAVSDGTGGLGGRDSDNAPVTTYSLEIAHKDGAQSVTIKDTAMAKDDDPKFEDQMAGLPDSNGFGGSMHMREMPENDDGETVTEIVIVRTDIDAPKAKPFSGKNGVYDLDVSTNTQNDSPAVTNEALNVFALYENESDTDEKAKIVAKVMGTDFETSTAGTLTFQAAVPDDASSTDVDESVPADEVMGTYDGADGTYKCTGGTDCMVTVNDKGVVTDITSGWIFTPDSGEMVDVPDTNYLRYGFWLQKTDDADGTTYNAVETFADAVGHEVYPTDNTGIEKAVGSASYKGGAAGVYVHEVNPFGASDPESATSGHFTADVTLNATFGGGNVADNMQFTIGGHISDFQLSGDEENSWRVKLELADFSGRPDGNDPGKSEPGDTYSSTFNDDAEGGGNTGSWNGTFYGAGGLTDATDDGEDDTNHPVAVAGEFNANFSNGTVAGGFGANKK